MGKSKYYIHTKTGGLYELLCEATHTETTEGLVIYQSVQTKEIWARPREMFFGKINIHSSGQEIMVSRFQPIKDEVAMERMKELIYDLNNKTVKIEDNENLQ